MARSAGITVSAVVVFIGSAFTVLFGAVMVAGSLFIRNSSRLPNVPGNFSYVLIAEAVFFFAFGVWGIATGVGLVNTRQWARISIVIFAGILIFFSLPATLVVAFVRLPTPSDSNLPQDFATLIRAAMAIFYATLSCLGGFWLYFFNKAGVKAQFRETQFAGEEAPHALQSEAPRPLGSKPLSISIIGWFLLISSALAPLSLLYSQSLFPTVPMPLCFLGFFFFGRSASVIFLTWMAVQIVAAIGLLRLKNWGRIATIALQCLGLANVSLLVLVPANRTRFQNVMESLAASMNARMPQPAPFVFPVWMGLAAGLPVAAVILWFVITRKQAFVSAGRELPR